MFPALANESERAAANAAAAQIVEGYAGKPYAASGVYTAYWYGVDNEPFLQMHRKISAVGDAGYRVIHNGYGVELASGVNITGDITLTYTPIDDSAIRAQVTMAVANMLLANSGGGESAAMLGGSFTPSKDMLRHLDMLKPRYRFVATLPDHYTEVTAHGYVMVWSADAHFRAVPAYDDAATVPAASGTQYLYIIASRAVTAISLGGFNQTEAFTLTEAGGVFYYRSIELLDADIVSGESITISF